MPAALDTDLSAFHQFVTFEALPAGQFTKVKCLADAIHGKVYTYQWQREGRETVLTQALLELDEAISIVQAGVASGDVTDLTQFAQRLVDGGGSLRSALAKHGWRNTAFRSLPQLEELLRDLQQAKEHLEAQLQDVLVVVKKMPSARVRQNEGRQVNEARSYFNPRGPPPAPHVEDAMTEIGVLSHLRALPDMPVYLLRLLGVFMEGENVLMVTEFIDSELFNQVATGSLAFPEDRVMRYTWQLFQAVRYLHSHRIGHRDISLENILVTFGDDVDGRIRLMDFGQAVRTHSADGLVAKRYFIACGKQYYRSPECYIPRQPRVLVVPPQGASPGDVVMARLLDNSGKRTGYACQVRLPSTWTEGQPCAADAWGYEAIPLDIFSCGVALFILAFKAPPWKMAMLADPGFAWIMSNGPGAVTALVTKWGRQPLADAAMEMLAQTLQMDPARRPSAEECLQSPWFAPMADVVVPTHRALPGAGAVPPEGRGDAGTSTEGAGADSGADSAAAAAASSSGAAAAAASGSGAAASSGSGAGASSSGAAAGSSSSSTGAAPGEPS